MKLKRIKKIKINYYDLDIIWDTTHQGGSFNYGERTMNIGCNSKDENEIFMVICHELMEIVAIEMHIRMQRPDCLTDYLFVYDHRQYDTMMAMFSGLLRQFIK